MAQRSKEYWLARSIQREQEAYLRGAALSQRLFSEYDRSVRALRKSIQAFYGKYATEHGLSYEDAMNVLTRREAQEWKASLAEYVAQINAASDPKAAAELTAQLDALSINSRISRLEALLGETQAQMDMLYDRCLGEMRQEFGEVYAESYYQKHFDLQSRAGWINEISKLTPGMIEDAVSYPWSGAMFSDRLWQNKSALLFNMRETITQSLIQGKSLPETSKALAAKMGQSYKVAERLVRTETNHIHNRADLDAYVAAGIEEYEFMAALDARTCEECGALDGQHFKIKDAMPGTNFPPMHPNDRCTTVEYDPEDAADWAQSGEKMPADMSYEQWLEKQNLSEQQTSSGGTPITDKAVERVPRVVLEGYTPDQADYIQAQHKELLRTARDSNGGNEVAYAFSSDLSRRNISLGGGQDVTPSITGLGDKVFVMHNHPQGSSFSSQDIEFFMSAEEVSALSLVTNTGSVEILTKMTGYDRVKAGTEYTRALKKVSDFTSQNQMRKAVDTWISKMEKAAMIRVSRSG
ncbi:Phage Mu protein F like protein [anaerobic digester metagenome]